MTQEVLKFTKAITEPNTITFHNSNADWVMRITADRRIEVNEDVEVGEAAQKVLDAMQYLLKAQTQEPVSNDPLPRACNLAGVDYQTFLKIKAYMPVAPPQRTEQEPVKWSDYEPDGMHHNKPQKRPQNCGTGYCSCIECVMEPPQRTWVGLTDEQLRTEFGKLYPNDIGILELAENNRDFAVEAIGARHHWVAFQAGARAAEAKLKEKNT